MDPLLCFHLLLEVRLQLLLHLVHLKVEGRDFLGDRLDHGEAVLGLGKLGL